MGAQSPEDPCAGWGTEVEGTSSRMFYWIVDGEEGEAYVYFASVLVSSWQDVIDL